MKPVLDRLFHSPYLIPTLTGLAVVSLVLSSFAVFQFAQAQNQREQDRVASDVASCERGNENRDINRRIANGMVDYVDATVDAVEDFAGLDHDERRRLTALLRPARMDIAEAIDEIVNVECASVVLGA